MKNLVAKLAAKHKVSPAQIAREMKMGIKVEHEHTPSDKTATKIATDHLKELPNYYSKLKKYVESANYGQVSEARRKDSAQEMERLLSRIDNNIGKNVTDTDPNSIRNTKTRNQNERIMGALAAIRTSRKGENPAKDKLMSNEREFGVGFRDMATNLNSQRIKEGEPRFKDVFARNIRLRGY
jgi:bisphosphoglycerate-dependent phosphoglycerate mutase